MIILVRFLQGFTNYKLFVITCSTFVQNILTSFVTYYHFVVNE